MKIDWKSKQTRVYAIIIAIIIIPIFYNQISSLVVGAITAYHMKQPKTVKTAHPIEKDIFPTYSSTGRIEANLSVDIIARVNGWLQKRYFEEGDVVKKGQPLYLIEQDEYILAAKNARAAVNENAAVFKNAQIELDRATQLLKEDLVSREYYDDALAERNKYRAALDGSIAQLQKANLDLSYTNIVSPMDGRIGKTHYSVGNYVTSSSGAIAQIYTTSPMKVVFPIKSGDFIEIKKYYIDNPDDESTSSVILGLADGSTYDIEGDIEFVDNKIDENTGTVTLRAVFANPNELLVPGDYVNVTIRINKAKKVMLVPQSATKTDVGTGYYVWVVKDGKTVKKNIVVRDNIDNNWVVESGLDYDDEVVMEGIQDIFKSGQEVKTVPYEMKNENSDTDKAEKSDKTDKTNKTNNIEQIESKAE
ncbi:MAG: efflux RND transporter periplasmic adaptor subunit [Candidatus Gastranaerophilales bacterium]|nr:efflux RND transporter periplasmic adaptor subunit [Candidatus Gastranaerophilales bacterium]